MTINKLFFIVKDLTIKNPSLIKAVGNILFLVAIIYVVFSLSDYRDSLNFDLKIYFYLISFCLVFIATLGLGLIWYLCLKAWDLNDKHPIANIFIEFHLTSFLKYLPSGVIGFGTRHYRLVNQGIENRLLLNSFVTEFGLAILSALIIFFGSYCLIKLSLLQGLVVFSLSIFFLNIVIVLLFQKYKKNINLRLLYLSGLLFVIYHMIVVFCFWNLSSLDIKYFSLATFIYLIGWISGFLIPFVPGGLAVREGVIFHLALYHGLENYLLSSLIIVRVMLIFAECLLALLAYAMVLRGKT